MYSYLFFIVRFNIKIVYALFPRLTIPGSICLPRKEESWRDCHHHGTRWNSMLNGRPTREDTFGANQPYQCLSYRTQKNGAGRPVRKHGDRYGAHCLKLQCPAKSSSAVAARPTVATIDASAVELICLALHCACVMENV